MRSNNIIFILLLFIVCLQSALDANVNSYHWQIGEELTYKVKWSFIRLGTLKLHVNDTLQYNGNLVYHVRLYIDSNPLLFFVNMHSVYDSYVDEKFRIHLFWADEKIDNITYKAEYQFDYVDSLIHVNMTSLQDTNQTIIKDLPLDSQTQDGAAMIFYARANTEFTRTDTITSFFEAKKGKIVINFKGVSGQEKIDALESPLKTYYLDGVVRMKAIAGLTGPFQGWFAVDRQRPPLKAKLKVFIGSVNVELESWQGWQPLVKKN